MPPRHLLNALAATIAFAVCPLGHAAGAATPAEAAPVRVKLTTTAGDIVVQLESSRAPLSSADFLRYVTAGLYQQQAGFYRVVREDNDRGSPPIQVIQGGLLDENRELPPVAHEPTSVTGLKHLDGSLSLARGAPGTGGGAAFFICVGDQPGLDAGAARNPDRQGFAVFGRVVSGMEVVRRIHASATDPAQGEAYVRGQMLKEPVRITRAAVVD